MIGCAGLGDDTPNSLFEDAFGELRGATALREDLLAVLFPHGQMLPSEYQQSLVRTKLRSLVDGIERELLNDDGALSSWDLLASSGLLREAPLIDFVLARIAEAKLRAKLTLVGASPLQQLPVRLLQHDNPKISGLASQLLSAEQAALKQKDDHHRLDGESLHSLCWRIVAVLQQSGTTDLAALKASAEVLLARHDAMADPFAVARKLVFFLGPDAGVEVFDPEESGLPLFISSLSHATDVSFELLLRLIDSSNPAALAIILRAAEVAFDRASKAMRMFTDGANILSNDDYTAIAALDARAAVSEWLVQV